MASDGGAPESEPASARRAWQGQKSDADDSRGSRRRFKLIVLIGMLSALVALVIVFISYLNLRPSGPDFLTINIEEYNHKHFPRQLFAKADSKLLMRHFEGKKHEATTRERNLLLHELKSLKDRSEHSLVIHLTALALCRDETDRKSTRLNSSHIQKSRMPSSA